MEAGRQKEQAEVEDMVPGERREAFAHVSEVQRMGGTHSAGVSNRKAYGTAEEGREEDLEVVDDLIR